MHTYLDLKKKIEKENWSPKHNRMDKGNLEGTTLSKPVQYVNDK